MTSPTPFQPLDKACLAATEAPWATFAPTWRLEYRGTLTEAQLATALNRLVARYPWCSARVSGLAWVLPAQPTLTFTSLDLRSATDGASQELALAQRFLDLEHGPPLIVTWVRRTNTSGALVFQQHHALADGRAFFALLEDFITALDGELPGGIVPRLPERSVLARPGLLTFFRGAFHTLRDLALATLRPLAPLLSNTGADYAGLDRTRHLFIPFARLEAWREGRKRLGLSANDLLAGALCTALARWSHSRGPHNLLMPIDVRPRTGFDSFANHLSSLQLRWRPLDSVIALAQHLRDAAAPILAARIPWLRILFDGWVIRVTPLAVLRKTLLHQRQLLTNFSFSNLIPLGPAKPWRTPTIEIDRVLITTPCTPPQAANTTLVRYGDELCFNFNFKDSALAPAQLDALVTELENALVELDKSLINGS